MMYKATLMNANKRRVERAALAVEAYEECEKRVNTGPLPAEAKIDHLWPEYVADLVADLCHLLRAMGEDDPENTIQNGVDYYNSDMEDLRYA